jgi:phytoene dehydrogenase-like protein
VVGSGPNGLAAAVELARSGWVVTVYESASVPGGGARTSEITLPGFHHDTCSAVHPMGACSPFFASLFLEEFGLRWVHPEIPLAHALDGGAAVLARSFDATAASLDRDGDTWRALVQPLSEQWSDLLPAIMGPLTTPRTELVRFARFARFGVNALGSATGIARRFRGRNARALFAGLAAHSMLPLERRPSAAFALVLAAAGHAVGWPVAKGGSQHISDALVGRLESLGGAVETGREVTSMDDLPRDAVVVFDVTPRQLIRLAGAHLPRRTTRALERFRYGPGVFKVDYALSDPVPWSAPECRRAGTVHVGGTLEEIAHSERMVWDGGVSERPFVIVAQPSLFDDTRAPRGKHVLWAYCHVPAASDADMTAAIENQIERFAPGFKDTVLARHTRNARAIEEYNPNYVGGDIGAGAASLRGMFARPRFALTPYATPNKRIFICSASTPPGGGVHGMCGYHAARAVMRKHR